VGAKIVIEADVENDQSLETVFSTLEREWGSLDFVVHAIAFSDRNELKGRYVDTTRANFRRSMEISCFSFTDIARRAAPLMKNGGSLITLTYAGSQRVMPSYNVMGVAKAALEASVRYLAADLGPQGVRVNALSPGPMRTLAGSAVGDARNVFKWYKQFSPLRKTVELQHVGGAALYFLSELSAGVTGEIHYIDAGFNVTGMPSLTMCCGFSASGLPLSVQFVGRNFAEATLFQVARGWERAAGTDRMARSTGAPMDCRLAWACRPALTNEDLPVPRAPDSSTLLAGWPATNCARLRAKRPFWVSTSCRSA
jgi:enoyl-[acyl-carrier-protein] reductase (NADH)